MDVGGRVPTLLAVRVAGTAEVTRKIPDPVPDKPPTKDEVRAYMARARIRQPKQNGSTVVDYAALKAKHRSRKEADSGGERDP